MQGAENFRKISTLETDVKFEVFVRKCNNIPSLTVLRIENRCKCQYERLYSDFLLVIYSLPLLLF